MARLAARPGLAGARGSIQVAVDASARGSRAPSPRHARFLLAFDPPGDVSQGARVPNPSANRSPDRQVRTTASPGRQTSRVRPLDCQ